MLIKRLCSLFCVISIILFTFSGCSSGSVTTKMIYNQSKSASDEDWEEVDGTATLENNNMIFELDSDTTHFKIIKKTSGDTYYSVPQEETEYISDEVASRLLSEITLEYYGEQTDKMFMYSDQAVQEQKPVIKTNGESVRVIYQFGDGGSFVPVLFDEETFAEVLDSFENDALRRRFERYYTFTSVADKQGEYTENLKIYPVLEKENLYIINSLITDIDKSDIISYLSDAGFELSTYEEMLKRLGITDIEIEKNAGYTIPIEYTLNDDGFTASILADLITENSEDFKLQKVNLLEYFSAFSSNSGSFFVPDGSGASIDFGYTQGLSAPYYGKDYSVNEEKNTEINYNLSLPVFGINGESSGVFAIIEQAAEVAELNVEPKNTSSPANHAYVAFTVRNIDVTDYGESMQVPIYNLFSQGRLAVSPMVKYVLLSKEENTYSSMANLYAGYLKSKGIFNKEYNGETPIYLDYLCMITEDASIMGISYTKKTVLSTISEIIDSVEEMKKANLGPIVIRLFGYASDGFEHSAYNQFNIDKRVGTVKELRQLNEILEAGGGKLYLDADVQFAYQKGNGFNPSNDAARYLNRLIVCRGSYDIVTRKYSETLRKYYISPANYERYASDYINSLSNKWNSESLPGVSYGSAGCVIGGDYSKKREIDRSQSVALLEKAFSSTEKKNINMVFDNGNFYVLKYASALLNIPTESSLYDSESNSIPFVQMVLHGNMSYAAIPQNISANPNQTYLDSVLLGASPYACFITKEDSLIFNTPYETQWYSLSSAERLNDFIKSAKASQKISAEIGNATLTGYKQLSDAVKCSSFSNGKSIYVNYSSSDVTMLDKTIPAYGFVIGE